MGSGDRHCRQFRLHGRELFAEFVDFCRTGFTGCGKSALFVILSEAKNLSWFNTQN
jgi:hypothetical protein